VGFSGEPEPEVLHGLFGLRTIVEPAAAALAPRGAIRVIRHDAARSTRCRCTRSTWNKAAWAIGFHAALLRATANPYIVSLTNGVTAAVNALTEFKQRIAPLKRDPVPDHLRVYDAIAAKDAEGARAAMTELIRLAIMDTPIKQRQRHVAATRAQREARH
jgi:DNA-binding FadR family transcriptional regulator